MNGHFALFRKTCVFWANHENFNEDRPVLSAAKMYSAMTVISDNIRFMRIFAEFPWGGVSNDSGVVDNVNFQRFRWLFFGNFRDEASVIM